MIESSLSSINMINNEDIVMGRRPENENEIVLDKMAIDNTLNNNEFVRMIGLIKAKDFLDKKITINNMPEMTIVGITDLNSPAVYVSNGKLIDVLYHINNNDNDKEVSYATIYNNEEYDVEYEDYNLFYKKVVLKEGKWPVNDYETIVNISNKEDMKIGKEISKRINNHKLKVVGYYTSEDSYNYYLVNKNMIKYKTIGKYSNIVVYSKNKDETMKIARDKYKLNIKDSYEDSKEKYNNSRKEDVKSTLISAAIILSISLIEILLMMRSSFLSRIKEVGTYRAIGVKKKDIYIMFSGEIIAITLMASVPGILICAYIINQLSHIKYLEDYFMINSSIVIISIILVFVFNLLVGLIPVFNTIRKRPAEILARTDI